VSVFAALVFLSLCCYLFLGLLLRGNINAIPLSTEEWQPRVSVVIPARNEEAYLADCLSSLQKIDYPSEKVEIVIVNDASTDRTADVIAHFASRLKNLKNVALLQKEKVKPAKAGALLAGIEHSKGEVIFFTDADCRVPSSWIRDLLRGFRENVGIVGGFTLLPQNKKLFEKLQALDWQYLLSIAGAASQLKKPITWVGNNMAIRRHAYDQVGGYREIRDSLVEDFALINAIEKQTTWQCRFYASPHSVVRTQPAASWRQLYEQRKRWSLGIVGARPFGWLIMTTAFLLHVFILLSFIFCPICALISLSIKMATDLLIFKQSSARLNESFKIQFIFLFQLYYIFSSLVLPILLLFDRRIHWKGIDLKRNSRTFR
jgi:cellulose synthase/poly-beta-1,6-N-acetylglucosamine synthase-like glycosyltransferase